MPVRPPAARAALVVLIALCAATPFGPAAVSEAAAADTSRPAKGPLPGGVAEGTTAKNDDSAALLASRRLIVPIAGIPRQSLRDSFDERRGSGRHEAIDIFAPRGTPVVAVGDGRIVKLFDSARGGRTIYQFDRDDLFVYYYAHLESYAEGLRAGNPVKRGDVLGYVGATGNAAADVPHLHFAIFRLGPERVWWQGTPMNPYAFLNDPER
jgi:peptidoglycan LD-endopeptidase LytH